MSPSGPYGYKSEQEFLNDVQRELDARAIHDSEASWERSQPKPQRLRGKPNSPERIREVARIAGVDEQHFLNTVSRDRAGQRLVRVVKKLSQGYDREALDEAAELTISLGDENVARAAMNAMHPEMAKAYYERMVEVADGRDQSAEEERIADRQRLLAAEYERAERLGPGVVEQVDKLARTHVDAVYDDLRDDEVQVLLRAQAEQARSERYALNQLGIKTAITEEIIGGPGAPGSHWNDEDRQRWEDELRVSSLEEYENHVVSADEAIQKAAASLDRPPSLSEAMEAEFDSMALHYRENLEEGRPELPEEKPGF